MSKHTPGPWEISDTVHIDGNGTYRRIQQPHFGGDIVGLVCVAHLANSDLNGSGPANARLIAAGPELLQALRNLVEASDAMRGTYGQIDARGYDEDHHFLHDKWAEDFLAERTDAARAAIAKATGEAP